MEQRFIGESALKVSAVGLGCSNFGGRLDLEATCRVVHRALDLGVTFFDTADSYGGRGYGNYGGSERFVGQALGPRRKDIVLATKFGMAMNESGTLKGASPPYVMAAVDASLKRLGTDWIDLYQIHLPDPNTPIEETLRALDALVGSGKVRYIGCSNFSSEEIVAAQGAAKSCGTARLLSTQAEYSIIVRDIERDLLPTLKREHISLVPYFPLAGGLLTGKYPPHSPPEPGTRFTNTQMAARHFTDRNRARVDRLQTFCASRGVSLLEASFSWLLAHDAVASVIAGASRPEQLEQNVHAASRQFSCEEIAAISQVADAVIS